MKHILFKFRQTRKIDFILLISVIILCLYGVINIFYATNFSSARKQLLFVIISCITLYIILFIDYSYIKKIIPIIYFFNIGLLIFTKLFSNKINGANAWIQIGNFTLQPAEFMKISLILMISKIIDEGSDKINDKKYMYKLAYYILLPLISIIIQPDMGMTIVCFIMSIGVLFISGVNIKIFFAGLLLSIFSILLVWDTNLLPEYWKSRIVSFLNPTLDSMGNGLQVSQSKIGIGIGGIVGRNGNSSYVSQFVPEPQNDFIFSIIGEYWGFLGSILLLIVYVIIIMRILKIARSAKDKFGELFCIGMVFYILYSVFQNIGMTIGLIPVTGINLPFVSYGGSSILSNMIGIAIVLNINMRKQSIVFVD